MVRMSNICRRFGQRIHERASQPDVAPELGLHHVARPFLQVPRPQHFHEDIPSIVAWSRGAGRKHTMLACGTIANSQPSRCSIKSARAWAKDHNRSTSAPTCPAAVEHDVARRVLNMRLVHSKVRLPVSHQSCPWRLPEVFRMLGQRAESSQLGVAVEDAGERAESHTL